MPYAHHELPHPRGSSDLTMTFLYSHGIQNEALITRALAVQAAPGAIGEAGLNVVPLIQYALQRTLTTGITPSFAAFHRREELEIIIPPL